jgi:hypothetical protein
MDVLARRHIVGYLIMLLAAGILWAAADGERLSSAAHGEYEIKGAMLYNFTKFIEWPEGALGEASAPLVVGVLGNEGFGVLLDVALRDKNIYGHPITVRRFASAGEPIGCRVLFIGTTDRKQVKRILQSLGRSAVLTIGDGEEFAVLGGVIGFIEDGARIRFEINRNAAERAGLQVSSKLLGLATVRRDAFLPPKE